MYSLNRLILIDSYKPGTLQGGRLDGHTNLNGDVAGWKLATSAHKFRDWRLAIAAYNCGDGAVARAIKKRGSLNIAELDIPTSTKTSLSRLIELPRLTASGLKQRLEAWQQHPERLTPPEPATTDHPSSAALAHYGTLNGRSTGQGERHAVY